MLDNGTERDRHAMPAGRATVDWLSQLPVPAAVLCRQGDVLEWNDEAAALFGWSGAMPVRLGEPGVAWFDALQAALAAGGRAASTITRRVGQRRHTIELRCSALDENCSLVLFRDCTAQVVGRALRHSGEHHLRGHLDRLPDPVIIEQDGAIVYGNAAAARLFGETEPAALAGRPAAVLLSAEVLARARRIVTGTQLHPAAAEAVVEDGAGVPHPVQVSPTALTYEGRPALQLLLRDITAQRQAESALRAAHERMRIITELVRDHAILTLDAACAIVSWNTSAERLTGYRADDIVGRPATSLLETQDTAAATVFDEARAAGRAETETLVRRQDGTTFRAQLAISSQHDPAGAVVGYAVIVRDLTERVKAEESLHRSEEQLRHAQKMEAVGRLAAGLAHDFNNLLTAIQGHVQFLLEDLPADATARDDAIEIRNVADRATELTRQLMTFARRQPSRAVPLNVNDVVTGINRLLQRLLRADISLQTVLHPALPDTLADRGQLEQVLVNLVVNARDAMLHGGTIAIRTSLIEFEEMYSARDLSLMPGAYVQLSVSDTGCGMSEDVQRQIFEPFFTTKVEGTGLGLATVYGIVKQSGGHISTYTEEGVGTTFKVFLPVHAQPAAGTPLPGGADHVRAGARSPDAARAPSHRATLAPAAMSGDPVRRFTGTVLLVEDDTSVRDLAVRTLRNGGLEVLAAADGAEALKLADDMQHDIDVVVTDLMMPNMSGTELADRIAASHPEAGIVLMSGFDEESLVRDGRIRPRQRFLEKPFTQEALLDTVREALRG